MIDKTPLSTQSIAQLYNLKGKKLQRQYRNKISAFKTWKKTYTSEALIYPENIGEHLSIDETALSNGELYTVITNKKAKGKKGSLVALLKGTKSEEIISKLLSINSKNRNKVKEITLDMAPTMINICSKIFPSATQVTDRFHVQKLVNEAVQDIRIKYRWIALNDENSALEEARKNNKRYIPQILQNGDTIKQLLARSRYLLFKHHSKWSETQETRANILFCRYPEIKQAYLLSSKLFVIFQNTKEKGVALTKLAHWYKDIEDFGNKAFNTAKNTIQQHYRTILNYFDNKSTNASAESFNAKIKAFRSQFRGVRDVDFFLFRLQNIFA